MTPEQEAIAYVREHLSLGCENDTDIRTFYGAALNAYLAGREAGWKAFRQAVLRAAYAVAGDDATEERIEKLMEPK